MDTRLSLAALLTLSLLCPVQSWAVPVRSLQSESDYGQLISKRQVVDQLLGEARQIYDSPARVSDAGFTAKMPSNMELVTSRLLEAYQLEPYRTDLLISAANAQIYNGKLDRAIALLNQTLTAAPDDVDLLSYLAVWLRVKGDEGGASQYLDRVKARNPGREADLRRLFATIDRVVTTPLKERAGRDQDKTGRRAIVTLGYALNPDGSMSDILLGRLDTTRALAKADPQALIIVSGGVPQNRKTEASVMADWLVSKGISRSRIIEDNYATSTVENALNTAWVLARHQIDKATLVSSASHVRRGQTLLEIACWQTGPANIRIDSVSYPDKPVSSLARVEAGELLGIYRDALRTYGMWSYRSPPLLAR